MSAQYGQDRFVLEVLNGLRGGFFLDSGASDGVSASNTLLLERAYGWRGVCVEPDADFYAALARNRRCHLAHCCLYDRDTEVAFLAAGTLGGIVAEYDPAFLRHVREAVADAPTRTLPARTISSVLREAGAPPVIDYWSLDTEGSELALLRSFPYEEFSFRVLTVEHNWLSARAEIRAFLAERGYRWAGELGCDDCYVLPGALPIARAWRSAVWARSAGLTGRGHFGTAR